MRGFITIFIDLLWTESVHIRFYRAKKMAYLSLIGFCPDQ